MSPISIVTDSTASIPASPYEGQELVSVVPLHIQAEGMQIADSKEYGPLRTLFMHHRTWKPQLCAPDVETFHEMFTNLGRWYEEIIVILIASHLNSTYYNAQIASQFYKGPASIYLIDSQTTGVGLGLLVQAAAQAAMQGASATKVSQLVRGLIPHIYTAFCLQTLTYYAYAGHLDPAQGLIGEMLSVLPLYIFENGRMAPVQKARSSRQMVDMLNEFIGEFDHVKHIALIQGIPPFEPETRNLRERIAQNFPEVAYSEHELGISLACLFGPRTFGVIVMEEE